MTPRNRKSVTTPDASTVVPSLDVCPDRPASSSATPSSPKTEYLSNGHTHFSCQRIAEFDAGHLASQRLIRRNGLKTP
jgi:hypothetical protein